MNMNTYDSITHVCMHAYMSFMFVYVYTWSGPHTYTHA